MSLLMLILLLVAGGLLAWASERLGPNSPQIISISVLLLCLAFTLGLTSSPPSAAVPEAAAGNWFLYWKYDWLPRLGMALEFGVDGIGLLLVLLTLALGVVAVSASWTEISWRPGFFHANLMFSLAGVIGVFTALDLLLFFVFWEVMLVPMYLLIAIWGHEARAYASMKFFIYTQASGMLLLLATVVLAWQAAEGGALSFSYFALLDAPLSPALAFWLMLGFFVAFAVKLPTFPLHSWLPDAHTQAPTAGSVLLAGVLLKTGAYGLLRFCLPLFPDASREFAPIAMFLGVAGVLYAGVLAFAQQDFKRLVAYSSISHMGFVILGLYAFNALGLQGAVMQMVAHGVSSAALFTIAGALQHRLHTRDMARMGGLWTPAPQLGAATLFFALAALGLPGLGNFVGEFLVFLGLFAVAPWTAAIAALGMVTAAVYALQLVQRSFHGPLRDGLTIDDCDRREQITLLLMMAVLLWLGILPQAVLTLAQPGTDAVLLLFGDLSGGAAT